MFPISKALASLVLKVLGPGRAIFLSGDTVRVPLNLKVRLPPDPSGLLVAIDQQVQKGIIARTGVINLDHEEVGLMLPNGGHSLLPYQTFTINDQIEQLSFNEGW